MERHRSVDVQSLPPQYLLEQLGSFGLRTLSGRDLHERLGSSCMQPLPGWILLQQLWGFCMQSLYFRYLLERVWSYIICRMWALHVRDVLERVRGGRIRLVQPLSAGHVLRVCRWVCWVVGIWCGVLD